MLWSIPIKPAILKIRRRPRMLGSVKFLSNDDKSRATAFLSLKRTVGAPFVPIAVASAAALAALSVAAPVVDDGHWPSFRGPGASGVADGQNLPDAWDGATGDNIRWRVTVPGLAHSSPVVWGDRLYVTSAVSSRDDVGFRPGLYGDGDASSDHSVHRWVLFALDKHSGETVWERVVYEGTPIDTRHVKSTYASSTPATDGRTLVASFGSQGLHAFDMDGTPRWSFDPGRVDIGAYDAADYEWGPASSPILWNGMVIAQYDTQAEDFLVALDARNGATIWRTPRHELPSWGTPTVYEGSAASELITNSSNYVYGYDPATGEELWRLGGSSKITAPTPVFSDDFIVIASGRHPERPIFVVRPGARGDITPTGGASSNAHVAWSSQGRGPYMPTPLIYRDQLYVLANNGVFDAYELSSGRELYRVRLPHLGSGFSSSPVAADGRIYLCSEDGEILVLRAGSSFEHIATNSMGELLMATPALSDGVMYVRGERSLFAVAR